MKKLRLIITKKAFEVLNAFLEDNYLENYIAYNESDLYYKNILNFPDLSMTLKNNVIFFAKEDINQDDEYVFIDALKSMKKKNATYYSYILDTDTNLIKEFSNKNEMVEELPYTELKDLKRIKNIEEIISDKIVEQEMVM